MLIKNLSRLFSISRGIGPTQNNANHRRHKSMLAWTIRDSLNNPQEATIHDKLKLTECPKQIISTPSEVLIEVHASSINPLDYRMIYGYGRRVLDLMDMFLNNEPRVTNDRYPLILGRDFSGVVVDAGPHSDLKSGDSVFGAIEPHKRGAHSQYVIANSCCISKKPENLTHPEAASIPFTSLTCYSALVTFGHLSKDNCQGKLVLVVGGSGGVGSIAIQLLKTWGARVEATCSEDKMDWLENSLFVDKSYNHDETLGLSDLKGRFDFILDCGAYDETLCSHENRVQYWLSLLKPQKRAIYVTLSPPFLSQVDKHGLILGTGKSIVDAACDTINGLRNLNSARWAFFMPNKSALDYITSLYRNSSILPLVSSTHGMKQIPQAYDELLSGRARGKVVIDMKNMEHNVNEDLRSE